MVGKLSLEELIGFVFTVETADYPVRIDTMKITRSKSEDVMVLSTTMELSAYSLISTDNGERK